MVMLLGAANASMFVMFVVVLLKEHWFCDGFTKPDKWRAKSKLVYVFPTAFTASKVRIHIPDRRPWFHLWLHCKVQGKRGNTSMFSTNKISSGDWHWVPNLRWLNNSPRVSVQLKLLPEP